MKENGEKCIPLTAIISHKNYSWFNTVFVTQLTWILNKSKIDILFVTNGGKSVYEIEKWNVSRILKLVDYYFIEDTQGCRKIDGWKIYYY